MGCVARPPGGQKILTFIHCMKPFIIETFGNKDYSRFRRRAAREQEITEHGRRMEDRPAKHTSKMAYSRKSKYPPSYE